MAKIMYGHPLSEGIKEKIREDVEELKKSGIEVGLGLLLAGDIPASKQYFLAIIKACKRVGITTHTYNLPEEVSTNRILHKIHSINNDARINGLLVLFPLPKRVNPRRIVTSFYQSFFSNRNRHYSCNIDNGVGCLFRDKHEI